MSAKGANATCSKTAIGIKSMHAWCDTTSRYSNNNQLEHSISHACLPCKIDIPWIDNTHVSLQCEWEHSQCVFQFWKDSQEQFYCELSDCTQTSKVYLHFILVNNHSLSLFSLATDGVEVHGKCENAVCGCMENSFMCGSEVGMPIPGSTAFWLVVNRDHRHVKAGCKCQRTVRVVL